MSNKIQNAGGVVNVVDNSSIINTIQSTDKKIYSVVLTGGPSGGKSTIVGLIKKYFNKYNSNKPDSQKILVLVVNETATSLINQGVTFTPEAPQLFQKLILKNQIFMEKTVYEYAEMIAKFSKIYDKVVIILDRGLLDGKAYLIKKDLDDSVEQEWNELIAQTNFVAEFKEHLLRYDLIIHIVTAAEGTGFFYTTENNAARTETPDLARIIDAKTLRVWERGIDKPIYLVDNREGIVCKEGKGIQIIKMISKLVGLPYTSVFTESLEEPVRQKTMVGGYLKYKSKYINLKNQLKN